MAGPFSGTIAIRAMKDGDFQAVIFPGTTVGLQSAVDYLAGAKGKVSVGPGTLLTTTPIWLHTGCHVEGCGIGITVIKRSTMANGDAADSGAVFATSAYGANGTLNGSGATQSDICVTDLTVDGNEDNFGSVTQANLIPSGIHMNYVDGVRVFRVRAINCLGDGFRIRFCRSVRLTAVETYNVGQWSVSAAKNGVNFIGDYAAAGNWGYDYRLEGASILSTGTGAAAHDAEAIQASGIYGLVISDVVVDTCDYVLECAPTSITTGTWGNWTINNVVATNAKGYFFTFGVGQASGYTLENVVIKNCTISGHATLHDGGAISLTSADVDVAINDFHVSDCIFKNINTLDTTTHNWVDCQPANTAGYTNLSFSGCDFYGLASSTRTGSEIGIVLRAPLTNIRLTDVYLKDVPGRGVHISDNANLSTPAVTDVVLKNVVVHGSNDCGLRLIATSATSTGTLSNIRFIDCLAKDTSKVTTAPGFQMNISQAGSTFTQIYFQGCRAYRTSGTSMNFGLTLVRSAGTVSEITITDCNFQVAANSDGMFFDSGATAVHYQPRPGKGPNIATAATIQIPVDGDVFSVTGNTNVTNGITVRAWDNGRIVRLIFSGTPTVSDTGTSKLNGDFVATADDVLTLTCDGTNWYEVARSAN